MNKKLNKFNDLQKMLIFAGIIGLFFTLISIVGVVLGQPGWMIGVVLGTLAEVINIILLYKGFDFILKDGKPGLFFLFFALRMVIAVLLFFVCIYLDKKLEILAFQNSIWGAVIGFAPIELVVLIVLGKSKQVQVKEVQ